MFGNVLEVENIVANPQVCSFLPARKHYSKNCAIRMKVRGYLSKV
jgi:hypothetical protein